MDALSFARDHSKTTLDVKIGGCKLFVQSRLFRAICVYGSKVRKFRADVFFVYERAQQNVFMHAGRGPRGRLASTGRGLPAESQNVENDERVEPVGM